MSQTKDPKIARKNLDLYADCSGIGDGKSGRHRESPTVRRRGLDAELREGEKHFGNCKRASKHSR